MRVSRPRGVYLLVIAVVLVGVVVARAQVPPDIAAVVGMTVVGEGGGQEQGHFWKRRTKGIVRSSWEISFQARVAAIIQSRRTLGESGSVCVSPSPLHFYLFCLPFLPHFLPRGIKTCH